MNPYKVIVSKSAQKELLKLPQQANNRIIPAILKLSEEPRPPSAKKLKGGADSWRIRVGDYRVIYSIDDEILIESFSKPAFLNMLMNKCLACGFKKENR